MGKELKTYLGERFCPRCGKETPQYTTDLLSDFRKPLTGVCVRCKHKHQV